jgi:ABC-type phosphate transport system auxiliary subunit
MSTKDIIYTGILILFAVILFEQQLQINDNYTEAQMRQLDYVAEKAKIKDRMKQMQKTIDSLKISSDSIKTYYLYH